MSLGSGDLLSQLNKKRVFLLIDYFILVDNLLKEKIKECRLIKLLHHESTRCNWRNNCTVTCNKGMIHKNIFPILFFHYFKKTPSGNLYSQKRKMNVISESESRPT